MPAGNAPLPRSSSARRHACWLVPCALALASTGAWADFRQDYGRALKAYEEGKFAEAQALFAQAAAEHPEPAARMKLYGMRFEPYVPQHYLGLIAAQSGDCGRARAQWSAAGNAQVVGEIGQAANEKCAGAVVQSRPVSAPAPAPGPAAPPVAPPPVASTPQRPATTNPTEPNRPVVLPQIVAKVTPTAPTSRPSEPPPEKADKAAPPDQLVQAFASFLGGRLSEVARINPDAYVDGRARFHAYLVRGGARFTLAKLNGDAGELESARADVRAARQLNASAAPDGAVFSPRFRAFYAETR
ncbi:MAG: hypothetical protein ABI846_02500 [Rudaea sp.]